MANTAQQTGAPVGTALHNAVAATATAADLAAHSAGPGGHSRETVQSALVHGYATAAGWAAAILVLAAITGRRLLKTRRPTPPAFPHTHPDRSRSTDSGTATARSTT